MRSYVRCRLEEKPWLTSEQERNIVSNKAWEAELLFIFHGMQPSRQKLTKKKGIVRTTLKSMLTKYSVGPKIEWTPYTVDCLTPLIFPMTRISDT